MKEILFFLLVFVFHIILLSLFALQFYIYYFILIILLIYLLLKIDYQFSYFFIIVGGAVSLSFFNSSFYKETSFDMLVDFDLDRFDFYINQDIYYLLLMIHLLILFSLKRLSK